MPEGAVVEYLADPALLDVAYFTGGHVGKNLVEDAYQYFLLVRHGHRQLVAVRRLARYIQAIELELAQAPDARGEVADHGVDLVCGQGLQRRTDIGHGHQVEVRVVGAQ
ncbi:hypothetical protein D3C86_1863740 [compost metagenome]